MQWIESNGAPEFRLEYTVFRLGTKGFRVMGKISQDLDTFHMPVDLKIETEGNPETKRIDVVGTSSEFSIDTFGKPKSVTIDPSGSVLRWSPNMRVEVAIKRGEQFVAIGELGDALKEYQKAIEVNRQSSLAHYRVAEIFFLQNNYQSAANEYREALNGDLDAQMDRGLGAHQARQHLRCLRPARSRGQRIQSGHPHARQYVQCARKKPLSI